MAYSSADIKKAVAARNRRIEKRMPKDKQICPCHFLSVIGYVLLGSPIVMMVAGLVAMVLCK